MFFIFLQGLAADFCEYWYCDFSLTLLGLRVVSTTSSPQRSEGTMKVLKLCLGMAIVLALAAPAWANNINVIFDPTEPAPGGGTGLYYILPGNNITWSVSWQGCTAAPGGVLPPMGPGSEFIGDPACLGFANYTGGDISGLNLTFTVSGALDGLTLTCSNTDSYLGNNNCASYSSPLVDGQSVTLSFTGPVNVPTLMDFFFAVTTTDDQGNPITIPGFSMPDSDLTVPTFDPSTLVLLLAGLGLLGLFGLRRHVIPALAR